LFASELTDRHLGKTAWAGRNERAVCEVHIRSISFWEIGAHSGSSVKKESVEAWRERDYLKLTNKKKGKERRGTHSANGRKKDDPSHEAKLLKKFTSPNHP